MNKLIKGLVLKSMPYKNDDIILTLFTAEYGTMPVICRGVRSKKKNPAVYCQLFCYSEFSLFIGRSMPIADGAEVIEQFYALRNDMEILSLAQYFADVCMQLPQNMPDPETLRLILNSLSLLAANKAIPSVIKIVFELKYAAFHGFAPDNSICVKCGRAAVKWIFDEGFLCTECSGERGFMLGSELVNAVRFIISAVGMRPYLTKFSDSDVLYLGNITSQYISYQLSMTFKSLEYYKKTLTFGEIKNDKRTDLS